MLTTRFSDWRESGWKTIGRKRIAENELIDYILTLLKILLRSGKPVRFEFVKAHSENVGNDGADALAVAGCSCPEIPERDWVGLTKSRNAEQDMVVDLMRGTDSAGRVVSPTLGRLHKTSLTTRKTSF